ncbi:hypothetical protein UFOVP232_78 [uncultured Caudovirales phage]|uniref:Uncharacterized protein n=1 Tax=uncultured Caudovirales phage TaxID=2100421 RepID=A0A6J7WTQ1_9CAUD|nr:hypothetical protein UFOVP232_78 [uncultured Caudovirales phage]
MTKEALKLALEAAYLAGFDASGEGYNAEYPFGDHKKDPEQDAAWVKHRDNALREALAQPEQEPAGWRPATFHRDNLTFNPGLPDEQTVKFWKLQGVEIEYCYTTPPQRKWVGLESEEIRKAKHHIVDGAYHYSFKQGAEWAEAKLKEKNT